MSTKRRMLEDTFEEMVDNHIEVTSNESNDEQNKEPHIGGFLYVESKGKFLLSKKKWVRRFCSFENGRLTISKDTVQLNCVVT